MSNFKRILLGSAAILLPGGLLVATGYLLYKKIRGKRNAVQGETGESSSGENENKDDT